MAESTKFISCREVLGKYSNYDETIKNRLTMNANFAFIVNAIFEICSSRRKKSFNWLDINDKTHLSRGAIYEHLGFLRRKTLIQHMFRKGQDPFFILDEDYAKVIKLLDKLPVAKGEGALFSDEHLELMTNSMHLLKEKFEAMQK